MPEKNPNHIAIIMDGNNRWARKNKKKQASGHHAGYIALIKIVALCLELKIKYLTIFAFSTENWTREKEELNALMKLLNYVFKKELKRICNNNIRVKVLGSTQNLSVSIKNSIKQAQDITKENTGLNLSIAFNYGGRDEIIRSVNKFLANKQNHQKNINEAELSLGLDTAELPDPDLIIRTSGEFRTSNFLTWQSIYSEYFFSQVLWPDFNAKHLLEAIYEYKNRKRRFGGR